MNNARFVTIRQAAKAGILPEFRLRKMQKAGQLPGIYAGNKFLINVELLDQQLDQMSKQQMAKEVW